MILNSKLPDTENGFFLPGTVADMLADGTPATYLAVYIYALRQLTTGNVNITNDSIAQALRINIIDVVNAFLFYSSRGLLRIHRFTRVDDSDFDIEFCYDTMTKTAPVPFKPSYKASEISRRLQENPRVSQMYKMVSQILSKTLSSADTELLYSFYDYYALPVEVIIVMIEYYVSKGKRSMKYLEKEAGKWASAGIDTVEKAKLHIKKREDFLSYASRVRTLLGIGERRLTERELTLMNKWQNELKMPVEMVKAAYELTANQTGRLSFAYMNKILESWSQEKIRTPEALRQKAPKVPTGKKASSRYDFDALQKKALDAVKQAVERKEENGV
ncbi:MAG: DnaD domain protein [Ruminococcaceae bacterium]|nr:DnaD domain protein [Oscillospiraceae bacterium]